MNEEILNSIDSKLTIVIRLIALEAVKGRPLQEQVELLSSAGMTPSEIAAALGKTPNNIRVQLHLVKKSKAKGKSVTDDGENA